MLLTAPLGEPPAAPSETVAVALGAAVDLVGQSVAGWGTLGAPSNQEPVAPERSGPLGSGAGSEVAGGVESSRQPPPESERESSGHTGDGGAEPEAGEGRSPSPGEGSPVRPELAGADPASSAS